MTFDKLILKKDKEKAIGRKHPWVFSGAFTNIPAHLQEGQIVNIHDHKGRFVGAGFYHRGSIAVKIFTFLPFENFEEVLKAKLSDAIKYRKEIGIFDLPETNCCRLVFAEGDSLPGLIIDKYADTAVVQIHHTGWLPYLKSVAQYLVQSGRVQHVFSKPSVKINTSGEGGGWILGETTENVVREYGHKFKIDWYEGQKTGFFVDQRENRRRLADFVKGKRVLNTFSYTGGFSIYALAAGAEQVVSVDISKQAIELAGENAILNGLTKDHSGIAADVFDYLQNEGAHFDVIILDPPAFSKSRKTTHNAVQGYKRLNMMALQKIRKGGIIFTFSCSQHISPQLFEDTIRAAAIETKRDIRVVEKLIQPSDHPVRIFHPEGEYLKGLILYVE